MIQKAAETMERQDLAGRIEEFYRFLNAKHWADCFQLIDPKLREAGKVEIESYSKSLSSFYDKHGPIISQTVEQLRIHLNEPSKHDERDFAYGEVVLEDRDHQALKIRERWVKALDGRWYTRMVGMV